MKVCFAPDYREGVPYQQLLAEALVKEGINVEFLRGYRRAFPLSRYGGPTPTPSFPRRDAIEPERVVYSRPTW